MNNSIKNKNSGLTLFEILVVLAVIGILSGIIIHTAVVAKEGGRKTVCLSNLRQLGIALHLYTISSSGYLPPYPNDEWMISTYDPDITKRTVPTDSKWPLLMRDSLAPYGARGEVWFCPSDPYKHKNLCYQSVRQEFSSYNYCAPIYFYGKNRKPRPALFHLGPKLFLGRIEELAWCDSLIAESAIGYPSPTDPQIQKPYHLDSINILLPDLSVRARLLNNHEIFDPTKPYNNDPCSGFK